MSVKSWTRAGNGNWTADARWSPSGTPTGSDDAVIAATGTAYTVVIKDSEAVHSLTIDSADATLRIDSLGSLSITDALDITAGTLILNRGDVFAGALDMTGGTVDFAGGNLVTGTLSYQGPSLDIIFDTAVVGSFLEVKTSLTVTDAAGTGAGTVNLSGPGELFLDDTQTLDHVTINVGDNFSVEQQGLNGPSTLTLGPDSTINQTGAFGGIDQLATIPTATLINQGTINVSVPHGIFSITPLNFDNQGTINGNGSGTLLTSITYSADTSFTNEGTINIDNGFRVGVGTKTFINSGTIAIGLAGTLGLTDPTAGAAPVNHGLIELASGTIKVVSSFNSAYHLDNAADGTISGHGTIDAIVNNSGLIEANGGLLTLVHAVSGTGSLQIDAGATLLLDSTLDSAVGVAFDGAAGSLLKITLPASFASTISGFSLGDIIDLGGITADGVTLNGANQLVVTNHGVVVDTLQLSGDYSHLGFLVMPDFNGGTAAGTNILAVPREIDWAKAVSGDFNDAGKWSPSLVPDETTDVVIGRSGAFTVSDTTDHTIHGLRVGNAAATLEASHTSLTVNGNVVIGGTLIADDASIHIGGAQQGTGTVAINGDSTVEFGALVKAHVAFGAGGQGTLALDQTSAFRGTIAGFGANDTIDFKDIGFSTAPGTRTVLKYTDDGTGNGGTLLVRDSSGDVAKLAMVGHYATDNFTMTDDGSGHVLVHHHDLLV